MLHQLYGRLARARRDWYERRPAARRRLARPVVSVGNLSVGGTGKTPIVEAIARRLLALGERPAILSRGYGRRDRTPEPAVVSDGARVLLEAHAAGDEPLMLARAVPGACVLVGADRYASGRHAEAVLGATVHVLDDGFQHMRLARDFDVVVTPAGALAADHVLPKGRLREPVDALARASALIVVGAGDAAAAAEGDRYGVPRAYGARRTVGAPVEVYGGVPPAGARVVAMAGIGQPAQFVDGLVAAGWEIAATRRFRDHHWFSARDLEEVARLVDAHKAWGALTTDKDAVRLEPIGRLPCAVARVPLSIELSRWEAFIATLLEAIQAARAEGVARAARAEA